VRKSVEYRRALIFLLKLFLILFASVVEKRLVHQKKTRRKKAGSCLKENKLIFY
jgi:hypothetical protein